MWTQRCHETVNPEAAGRMVSIHPKSGDTFYLRLLLKYRADALSYEDIRTIDGVPHPDNKPAMRWIFMRLTSNGLTVSLK